MRRECWGLVESGICVPRYSLFLIWRRVVLPAGWFKLFCRVLLGGRKNRIRLISRGGRVAIVSKAISQWIENRRRAIGLRGRQRGFEGKRETIDSHWLLYSRPLIKSASNDSNCYFCFYFKVLRSKVTAWKHEMDDIPRRWVTSRLKRCHFVLIFWEFEFFKHISLADFTELSSDAVMRWFWMISELMVMDRTVTDHGQNRHTNVKTILSSII